MDIKPLIAIAVITNGRGDHLAYVLNQWRLEGFIPGRTLYFCGPRERLLEQGVALNSIIDHEDPPYYQNNFHINDKKRIACEAIDADYIYIVHDRFTPGCGVLATLFEELSGSDVDFGALDVNNSDGTPSLRELRLHSEVISVDINLALESPGRLVCEASNQMASKHLALNGGQFFLRKSLIKYLNRPLRWMEMEDDILSHDLIPHKGVWIVESALTTLNYRSQPKFKKTKLLVFKYLLYKLICNLIAFAIGSISAGQKLSRNRLEDLLTKRVLLIDPFHKMASSDYLPSSLEKIMARARIVSGGRAWVQIDKRPLGWSLIGCNKVEQPKKRINFL